MGKYSQMMNQGGMADDGVDVAPNGNRVPPGSMANEVADDIDIKVSGGEYVVPADVTQYYGVKFFEDLRARAKKGLMEMESNGRIGGDPGPGALDEGLPFADEELIVEDIEEGSYAEGGQVPTYQAPVGSRPNLSFGRNVPSLGGTEYRTYENAQGTKKTILFMNGRPIQAIPEGFYPEGQVPAATKSTQTDTGQVSGGGDSDTNPFSQFQGQVREGMERFNPADMSLEDMSSFANQRDLLGKGLKAGSLLIGGPAGMLIGGLLNQGMAFKNREVYNEAKNRAQAALEAGNREEYEAYSDIVNKLQDDQGGMLGGMIDRFMPERKATEGTADTTATPARTGTGGGGGGTPTFTSSRGAFPDEQAGDVFERTPQTELAFGDSVGRADPAREDNFTDTMSMGETGPANVQGDGAGYNIGTPVEDDEDRNQNSGGLSFGSDIPPASFAKGGLVKRRNKRK